MSDEFSESGAGPLAHDELDAGLQRWQKHVSAVGVDGVVSEVERYLKDANAHWGATTVIGESKGNGTHRGALGRRVLDIARPDQSQRWIRRRTEELIVIDERTIERRVTFEIDIANLSDDELPIDGRGIYCLPLTRLDRTAHTFAKVQAVGHGELLRPTIGTERQLIAEGLIAIWKERGVDIDRESFALRSLLTRPRLRTEDTIHLFKALREIASVDEISDGDLWRLTVDIDRWRKRYLLLVEVPEEAFSSGQLVLVLTYKEAVPDRKVVTQVLGIDVRRMIAQTRRLIAGSMSWPLRIPVRGIGDAESSHVALSAPPGFRAVDAGLRVDFATSHKERWIRDDDRLPAEAHVYFAAEGRFIREAEFVVSFYAYKTGFFLQSLLSSIVLWGILQVFYNRVSSVGFVSSAYPREFDSTIAAAIVLLLPAMIVVLITQRDPHRLASKCFAMPRFLLALSAISSAVAAAMLTLRVSPQIGSVLWRICTVIAAVVAIRAILGATVHIWRTSLMRANLVASVRRVADGDSRGLTRVLQSSIERDAGNSWQYFPQVDSTEEVWFVGELVSPTEQSMDEDDVESAIVA